MDKNLRQAIAIMAIVLTVPLLILLAGRWIEDKTWVNATIMIISAMWGSCGILVFGSIFEKIDQLDEKFQKEEAQRIKDNYYKELDREFARCTDDIEEEYTNLIWEYRDAFHDTWRKPALIATLISAFIVMLWTDANFIVAGGCMIAIGIWLMMIIPLCFRYLLSKSFKNNPGWYRGYFHVLSIYCARQ